MMTSLFSVFDPSIYTFVSPWVFFVFFFYFYYSLGGGFFFIFNVFVGFFCSDFYSVIKSNVKSGSIFVVFCGFLFLFLLNFLALFPSIFTVTGHILFSFSFAYFFWSLSILISFIFNFNNFISHLVPVGTPNVLMSFMVLVELVSNLIRPITLSVRLAANMVAGHLLMGLLGKFLLHLFFIGFFTLFSLGLLLTILEMAVCLIQGYVFFTLFSLYSEDCH